MMRPPLRVRSTVINNIRLYTGLPPAERYNIVIVPFTPETSLSHCPRCGKAVKTEARFCAMCGLSLAPGHNNTHAPGTIPHPNASPTPEDHAPVTEAANLFYRTESAWGGKRLLGTENIGVVLINTGYPLRNVIFRVQGFDDKGNELFSVNHEVKHLEQDRPATVEVASYDIPSAPADIRVSLMSAEFASID